MLSLHMIRYSRLPSDIHKRLYSLGNLFAKDANITFAYLFGGLLREKISPLSDVDIAVFLRAPKKLDYISLIGNINDYLHSDEVDLVILNTAPISLAGRILQNRKILIDKEPLQRHNFESLTLRKYFDFMVKERDILHRRYGIG